MDAIFPAIMEPSDDAGILPVAPTLGVKCKKAKRNKSAARNVDGWNTLSNKLSGSSKEHGSFSSLLTPDLTQIAEALTVRFPKIRGNRHGQLK